jgi:hypothetical protein
VHDTINCSSRSSDMFIWQVFLAQHTVSVRDKRAQVTSCCQVTATTVAKPCSSERVRRFGGFWRWRIKNYWFFGLLPKFRIIKTRKSNVSETGSVSELRWVGDTYFLGSVRKRKPQWQDNPCQHNYSHMNVWDKALSMRENRMTNVSALSQSLSHIFLTFSVTFWDTWEEIATKKFELRRNHNWLLHHDNAPGHTSLKTTEFVTNNNMIIVPHPPYTPDLAPCDFSLSPKLKMKLKGRRSETVSDIRRESQAVLASITENDLHGVFEAWGETMGSLCTFPMTLFWRKWAEIEEV